MDDPFASIVLQCQHSTSQEDYLRRCRFYRESEDGLGFSSGEESWQGEDIPVASTGIVICSAPESLDNDGSSQEEFQTPPEESLLMSSDEQRTDLDKYVDSRMGRGGDDGNTNDAIEAVDDEFNDRVGTVDLGKDIDPGFSKGKSPADKSFSSPRTRVCEVSESAGKTFVFSEGESPVDLVFSELKVEVLGESSSERQRNPEKNLVLQLPEVDDVVDASIHSAHKACVSGIAENSSDSPVEKNLGFLKSTGGSHFNSVYKPPEDFQRLAQSVSEANDDDANASHGLAGEIPVDDSKEESAATEKLEFSNSPVVFPCHPATEVLSDKDLELDICTEKILEFNNPQIKEVHNEAEEASATKNTDELRKFVHIDSDDRSKDPRGRRELPASIRGLMQSAAETSVPGISSSENRPVTSLMDAIIRLSGERDNASDPGDVDILEIAKQRGMTFPRPRWWPPGGY